MEANEAERVVGRWRAIIGDARERTLRTKRVRIEIGGKVVTLCSDSRICITLSANEPVTVEVEE